MEDLFQKRDIVTHAIESGPGIGGPQLTERACQLTVLTGVHTNKVYEIESSPFRVGKGGDNDLQLPDPTVSREHFILIQEGSSFLIRDLGSTNGTWIDQMRIREAYLRLGAVIKAGDVQLRFEPVFKQVELVPADTNRFGTMVGGSLAMRQIFALLDRLARNDATVIILGETGTGKGAVARTIHDRSGRREKPFVTVDCGAIAENLIESELFGHERGAFTGATSMRRGALELAAGGTLFIDELVDLRIDLQPKLLRALEEREFRRLGSNQPLRLDARVVAATKRDLWAEVQAGKFREDLYFRLAVFTIPLPPLRDRVEDIPLLVERFAEELNANAEARARLSPKTYARFQQYHWPGNVRELRNAVERLLYFGEDQLDQFMPSARGDTGRLVGNTPLAGPGRTSSVVEQPTPRPAPVELERTQPLDVASENATVPVPLYRGPAHPPSPAMVPVATPIAAPLPGAVGLVVNYLLPFKTAKEQLLDQFEAEYLRRLLQRSGWQISQAAREAEIDRKHLYNLIKKYGLEPDGSKE